MSEPQQIEGGHRAERTADATGGGRPTAGPPIELDGGTWMLVPLEDGESWNLRPAGEPDAPRFAHITVSERGFFSIDRPGVVRGPYVTLSEAAYPLARTDGVLLADAADGSAIRPPTYRRRPQSPSRVSSWRRDLLLVLATVGILAARGG
jgi:hypothetical protein